MNSYRVIIKCQAGFLTVVEKQCPSPLICLKSFACKNVYSIEEKHGENYFTVFSLVGAKVYIASKDIYDSNLIQTYYPKTDMTNIGRPVTEYDYENKKYENA